MHRGIARGARVAIHRHDLRVAVGMAVDGDRQRAVGRQGTWVGDGVREHLGQRFRIIERVDIGIGVVQRIGIAAIGLDGQRAVFARDHGAHACVVCHWRGSSACGGGHDGRHRHVGHSVVGVAVQRAIRLDIACGRRTQIFRDGVGIRCGDRWIVVQGDGDGARLADDQRTRATRVATGLHVIAIAQCNGVGPRRCGRSRQDLRGIVSRMQVFDGLQDRFDLRHGRCVGEAHNQSRTIRTASDAGNAITTGDQPIGLQGVTGDAIGQGDRHCATAKNRTH